MILLRTEEA